MNKSLLGLLAVCGVLVGLFCGYLAFKSNDASLLGSAITNDSALNQARLFTALNSVVSDLQLVRGTAASLTTYVSSTATFGSLLTSSGNSTTTLSSSTGATVVTGSGGEAVLGDYVLISVVSSTPIMKGVQFTGYVNATGTIIVTASQATGTGGLWAGGNLQLRALVFPTASFIAPAALNTTTST